MQVNVESLEAIIRYCKDDKDDLAMVTRALETFEDYHRAIYKLELTRRLYACNALEAERYRADYEAQDHARTLNHDGLLAQVRFLNRLAEEAGVAPFYDGVVSKERPWRREVADAVLAFVRQVIVDRI